MTDQQVVALEKRAAKWIIVATIAAALMLVMTLIAFRHLWPYPLMPYPTQWKFD